MSNYCFRQQRYTLFYIYYAVPAINCLKRAKAKVLSSFAIDEGEKLVFVHDADAEFLCFLEFGGAHVVAGKDEACLIADATYILASMLLDEGFVFITAVMLEDAANDD